MNGIAIGEKFFAKRVVMETRRNLVCRARL